MGKEPEIMLLRPNIYDVFTYLQLLRADQVLYYEIGADRAGRKTIYSKRYAIRSLRG